MKKNKIQCRIYDRQRRTGFVPMPLHLDLEIPEHIVNSKNSKWMLKWLQTNGYVLPNPKTELDIEWKDGDFSVVTKKRKKELFSIETSNMKLWKISNGRWVRFWEEGDTKWYQGIFVIASCRGDAIKKARKMARIQRKDYIDEMHEGKTPRWGKDDYLDVILGDLNNLKAEYIDDGCTEAMRV